MNSMLRERAPFGPIYSRGGNDGAGIPHEIADQRSSSTKKASRWPSTSFIRKRALSPDLRENCVTILTGPEPPPRMPPPLGRGMEFPMNVIARAGRYALKGWEELRYLTGVTWSVLSLSPRPRYWTRSVRAEFSRQLSAVGLDSTLFVSYVASAVGISVVAQILVWLQKIGQSRLLGPLLVTVLIREAVPVVTNFLAIGRNGTAFTAELGNMKISGEVRVLEAQGLDPFIYLVMPRVLSLTVSVFFFSFIFIVVSFASGYLCGLLLNPDISDPGTFVQSILSSVSPTDVINFMAKVIIPALLTGAICCTEGLRVVSSVTEVPTATRRALARSIRTLFVTTALVSFLTYL